MISKIKTVKIILIISGIIILTSFLYIFLSNNTIIEKYDNIPKLSDIYKKKAIKDASNNGFSNGFAGSAGYGNNIYYNDKGFFDPSFNSGYYDSNNYNVQYHDDINTINANPDAYGLAEGSGMVIDQNGNKVLLSNPHATTLFTYYYPGEYSTFGPKTYVPNYQDSVYLSKTFNRNIEKVFHNT